MATKSSITIKEVKHVSHLAKLSLNEAEAARFKAQLASIFEYVNQIAGMRTQDVTETSQVTGTTNRFREDRVNRNTILSQTACLSQAKRTHRGYFVTKSIFKGRNETS